MRLCLEARAFESAKPVLDHDIWAFPTADDNIAYNALHPYPCSLHESSSTFITYSSGLTEKLNYRDHLQYFLFGGMIYTGLKDWERALHFFDVAIVSPIASKVSMIQVEAYKKRVLVGLLATGGVSNPLINMSSLSLTIPNSRFLCRGPLTHKLLKSIRPSQNLTTRLQRYSTRVLLMKPMQPN